MGTLSARNLRDALQKAKGVGLVEERFTVGDCEIVVRSLRPDEYEAILAECKTLEEVAYLNAFQIGHISRAIVELNGVDFRDVQFVDDEEPDPKKPGQTKSVKLELHKWLEKNVVSTWGKEIIHTTFLKVGDAVELAERQSKVGIVFLTPDETGEEKLRRLVGEVMELREELPTLIIDRVLDEHGLMFKTAAEEAKRVMEAADALAREQLAKQKAEEAAKAPPVEEPPTKEPPAKEPPVEVQAPDPMQGRQPLNQMPVDLRQAPAKVPSQTVPATRQQPSPPPPDATPSHAIQGPPITGSAAVRSAQMAALEAEADTTGVIATPPEGFDPASRPAEVPILERRLEPTDPKAVRTIIDQPPRVGLNPHFRQPRRA